MSANTPFEAGDVVHVRPLDEKGFREMPGFDKAELDKMLAEYLAGEELKIMLITPIQKARELQPASEPFFTMAEVVFGSDTRVLWLADKESPFYNEAKGDVNGFPVLLTSEGTLGLSGEKMEIRKR
jgi:hypothetical protein